MSSHRNRFEDRNPGISKAMHQTFTVKKQKPIYKPEDFRAFGIQADAKTIFDNVLRSMTSLRHSQTRINLNKYIGS